MDETRLADPYTLLLKGWTIWQDSLRSSDSHLTCIVKTNSPCLSSHVYIYLNLSYFYSYIIISATINHNNVYTITND